MIVFDECYKYCFSSAILEVIRFKFINQLAPVIIEFDRYIEKLEDLFHLIDGYAVFMYVTFSPI